jgi:hypothetical protein
VTRVCKWFFERADYSRQFIDDKEIIGRRGHSAYGRGHRLGAFQVRATIARPGTARHRTHNRRIGAKSAGEQETAMTLREQEEYSALRATIRQRGTARVSIITAGLAVWSAEAIATAVLGAPPAVSLIPLFLLAATFESAFALHVGVERIGRYIQVFHETDAAPAWEAAAMAFGRPPRGTATDPLAAALFAIAAVLNFGPVLFVIPVPIELIVIGGAHALFLARLAAARAGAARQRAADLARFREMRRQGSGPSDRGSVQNG